jgi:hypothetical protein
MPKISSATKPRLVVYLTNEEMAKAKREAKKNFLRTPHQLAGQWFREKLSLIP